VRHLVELHGGQVKVQSQGIGRGASFVVCLPISPFAPASCDRPPALRLATSKPEYSCLPELEAVRVLILEDDDDTRELLADILDVYKMRVSTAADVPGALQLIERAPPDIIVSDIGLSGEDGYVFIQKLRAIPANRGGKIPAIALTAYARVEDRTKALLAGFNMHIPKPVDPAELMAALSSFATLLQRA
jgi:CheY-like chemotaxis protein